MKFCELTDKEFMTFVNKRPEKNFFQTTMMRDRIKNEGKETYLVGLKDDKKIVAAAFIAETGSKFLGKKAYEAYKGFMLDYHDKDIL